MHPNPAFRPAPAPSPEQVLGFATAIGFAHIFAATADGPMVVHAPVTRHGSALRFHVARANRIAPHLDGADVLVSVAGDQGYISPNWYAGPGDQVPTWNYVAAEIDGRAEAVAQAALVEQLDMLAQVHEQRVIPENPWTSAKTDPAIFARMLGAIRGFEIVPTATRSTIKLSQNKSPADRDGVIEGLRRAGEIGLADAMAARA
ncbi:FMN-binding negative transcriptional regulator [Sphingomonas sp.]|uniref:FMN-binding negative transcriptional regulator n=1 Tax=Sphingomonas sp. TaxID=28214 RepID=UPI002EDA5D81